MLTRYQFQDKKVVAVFKTYPQMVRGKLLDLRELIFNVASDTTGVGSLEETLRWGQPGYLTTQSKSGSLIRLDQIKAQQGQYAMYFHCQTTLVDSFKEIYRGLFTTQGNRGLIFDQNDQLPVAELSHCIALALTYHLNKKHALKKI